TAPGMCDLDIAERRVDFRDLATNGVGDVLRVAGGVDLAAAEEQPPVRRLAEIADDETRVVDRLPPRQDGAVISQRHRRSDEGAYRHHMRSAHRLEISAIGVDCDKRLVGRDGAVRRAYPHLSALRGDTGGLRRLVQPCAGLRGDTRGPCDELE